MNHNEILVVDDCIPKTLQDYLEAITLGIVGDVEIEPSIPFRTKYEPTATNNGITPISFKHILRSSAETSTHLINFAKVPEIVLANLGRRFQNILYARIFLTVPYDTEKTYHEPHVDLDFMHTNLIYYVNDADGATVFFDEDRSTIIGEVEPKKGRAVLFNGLIPHSAGIPAMHHRCIANYNLII